MKREKSAWAGGWGCYLGQQVPESRDEKLLRGVSGGSQDIKRAQIPWAASLKASGAAP